MKPHQTNRSRAYYRHHRRRAIQRKAKIAEYNGCYVPSNGYFAKGKVHCSCWMCSQKTNKDGFPHSQVNQLERLNRQLFDYFSKENY